MKKIFTSLFLVAIGCFAFGQGSITGTITDAESNEPLIGATVTVKGTSNGTVSDINGTFRIESVDAGEQTVVISFTGFETIEETVTVTDGGAADIGSVSLGFAQVGLQEVNVIASVAIDRKTPVAVSTIKGDQVEALVGNQEFTEVLRSTPSVYVTKLGGGFGDSRINVRGFDQRNTAVMINGIPVNDMENGWVYWSNWAGLSDVTSQLQVQRGLGASKLAVASVGGSINVVTNAADFKRGGKASFGIGNDGYQKYGLVLSSGQGENGFAATLQMTHTRGDGYVDGTSFRAYSYFLSLTQRINDNQSISFTALGAPQWHHQRTVSNFDRVRLQTYRDKGIKFNHVAGTLNGEEFTWRKNFFHKPKMFLNHYWNINEKTDLKTSAYVSFGRGGGTGPRGRLRTPGSVFDSYSGDGVGIHNADGSVRFDDIVTYNQGGAVSDWGDAKQQENGQFLNTNDGRFYFDDGTRNSNGSGFVRRASMNYHNWYGVLSTLTTELSDNLTLVAGLDARYYKGEHFRRLENLLGSQGYVSRADDNNPYNIITEVDEASFGNFYSDTYETGNNVLAYHNDGLVNWLGLFAQVEYSTDKLNVFATLSGSQQGFKRIDYFTYLDSDPEQESDWQNFLGGTGKVGANFNLNDNHNVYANLGYFSKQPLFDNVFVNFSNDVDPDIENQTVYAVEAGYGYRSSQFSLNANLYHTQWGNRQFDVSSDGLSLSAANDTTQVDILVIARNVAEAHSGLEIDFAYKPMRQLTVNGMVSLGIWEYTDDFDATISNLDNDEPLIGGNQATIFANGTKVGDAAQTTLSLGVNYEPVSGLKVYATYFYFDNLYAGVNPTEEEFLNPGGTIVEIPSYSLVDAGLSYRFNFNKIGMTLRFNMNNVLDETYIAELITNVEDDPTTTENEFYEDNQGWYGFGRTWNAGLKINF